MYFEPEMEVINLTLEAALLSDSDTEAELDPTEGGQDEFPSQQ